MMTGNYYVYLLASLSRAPYVGMSNDLARRIYEHWHRRTNGFTARYKIERLVYFEHTADVNAAIAREKQIKKWPRKKKAELIESVNPGWVDLSVELFPDLPRPRAARWCRDTSHEVGRVDFSVGARVFGDGERGAAPPSKRQTPGRW